MSLRFTNLIEKLGTVERWVAPGPRFECRHLAPCPLDVVVCFLVRILCHRLHVEESSAKMFAPTRAYSSDVGVGVGVAVSVGVAVGVDVGVRVAVSAGVGVGVAVAV